MKKYILIFLCIVALCFGVISVSYALSNAEYIRDPAEDFFKIKFNNNEYIAEYSDDYYIPKQYNLIVEDRSFFIRRYYIRYGDFCDYIPPFSYFCLYNKEFDKYTNFIIENPNDSEACIYVRDDLILPTLDNNKVDMVCMSLDAYDEDNIKDEETIKKIVECAKSDGKEELDKNIYEYIKEHSYDNFCFGLKYEGYPIVEKFHVEETEDGRYIVDQYTDEEYETIYYCEH